VSAIPWSSRGWVWLLFLFLPTFALKSADRATLNSQLDIDDNKQLDYGEVLLGLRHRDSPDKVNLPKIRKDKKLPDDIYTDEDIRAQYLVFIKPRSGSPVKAPPYSLTEVDPAQFGLEKVYTSGLTDAEKASRRYIPKYDLQLRRSKDDLSKNEDMYAQAAIFSYGHDYDTKSDQWTAKGIIAFSYGLTENPSFDPYARDREAEAMQSTAGGKSTVPPFEPPAPALLRSIDTLFTLEFEKVDTSNGDKDEVDSLTFGGHVVMELFTGNPQSKAKPKLGVNNREELSAAFVRSIVIDLAAKWATDFSFKKKLYDVEIEVTPLFNLSGNGSYGHLIRTSRPDGGQDTLLAWRWGLTLHAEAGKIEEAAGEAALMQNDRFVRLGGRANVELLPFPDLLKQRLSLTASYLDYEALTADTHRSRLFRASAQYVLVFGTSMREETASGAMLTRDARATLRVEYQEGEIPLVQEKDKSLLMGLGIFF
jgi:hypothetical protein